MIVGENQSANHSGAHFLLDTPVTSLKTLPGHHTRSDLYSGTYKMAADSGMDTSPSPENADSRKRPLDSDIENGTTKRSHFAGGSDGIYHFKILVPSVAAGAIIGKGGETIAQLQKDTNARVKMSKANDFYPGTSERVCLISGNIEAIMEVLDFISGKIREKPDLSSKQGIDHDVKGSGEREKQVKILVPNSTAGMIIGKGGNYIKQLKEESGAYVQISQKAKDQSLQERCITVMGDVNNNKKACAMILSKVQEDPQSGSSLNVSYADVTGPVANFNPTGSPYAHPTNQQANQMMLGTGLAEAASLTGITLNVNLEPSNPTPHNPLITQVVNSLTMALHTSGYSDPATAEISSAVSTLAKYGMLVLGNSTSGFIGMAAMDGAPTHNGITSGVFGPIGTSASRTVLDLALEQFRHPASGPASPPQLNNNSFGLGKHDITSVNKETKKVDIEVPEAIVGAILGPGGRSLVEIQNMSGALIQISKKGIYAPGTRNRVVTISGTANSINTAQYLIEQKINEEKVKRTHQNPLLMLQELVG